VGQAATIFALMVGALLALPVAERLRIPHPVLCTGWGMLVALLPGATELHIEPDTMLALLLPPILYAAAQHTSWRQFVAHARPILLLAVVLVFVTAAAVAAAATHIHPALSLGAAIVLGALISPPDSTAAVSLAARLGLPRRLVTILEGEGLFNDVTALTLYQVTVYAVVSGVLTPAGVLLRFAYSIGLALVLGFGTAWIATKLLDRLPTARARAALSLLVPFAAYVPTAELHGSGVLAVLVGALYLGHTRFAIDDATSRVTGRTFWDVVELLAICLTFGLVGLELVTVIRAVGDQAYRLLGFAAVICGIVVVVRVLWLVPMTALARRRDPSIDEQVPADWRDTLIISWADVRGVVTVASALALPRTTATGALRTGSSTASTCVRSRSSNEQLRRGHMMPVGSCTAVSRLASFAMPGDGSPCAAVVGSPGSDTAHGQGGYRTNPRMVVCPSGTKSCAHKLLFGTLIPARIDRLPWSASTPRWWRHLASLGSWTVWRSRSPARSPVCSARPRH